MASDRLKLPPSPIKRTPSPTNKIILPFPEEKRKHGREILEKLRTTNRSSPTLLTTTGRTATSVQLSSSVERPDNTRTIQEKVRSTDNLSGKGLLAADLIKNLQFQHKSPASSSLPRADSARAQRKLSTSYPTGRPHSENSNRLLVPVASNLDRRGSLPATTLRQKSRAANEILRKYSGGTNAKLNISRKCGEGSLPSLRKAASANKLTTIHHESAEDIDSDRAGKKSTLDVRKQIRRASISVPRETVQRPQSSHSNSPRIGVNDGRVTSSNRCDQYTRTMMKNDELFQKENQNNSSLRESGVIKGISKEEESSTSGSESDNEEEVETDRPLRKNRTSVRNRNAKTLKGGRNEGERSCSDDDCSEDDAIVDISKRSRSKKKVIKRSNDDDTEEDEDSEDSSDECSNSEDQEKEDRAGEEDDDIGNWKQKIIKVPTDDSESEDESRGLEPNSDNMLIDEELEEMSKQFAVPGMPAMDLNETREKLAEERLINKQRGKAIAKEEEEDDASEDEVIDEADDLIDDIDNLIDADDEDIAYDNKLIKKKRFVKGVKAVLAANRVAVKDK